MASEPTMSETAGPPVASELATSETTGPPVASELATSEITGPPATPVVLKSAKSANVRADKRRWTTPEQLKYLLAQFPAYLEAQSHGRYDKFWPSFFRDWFEEFPPREPTDDDPSDSEGENDNDHGSENDDDDDDDEEADKNNGGGSKRKRKSVADKRNKKKKKAQLSEALTSHQRKQGVIIRKTKMRLKTHMRWHCPKAAKRKRQARPTSTLSLGESSSRRRLPKATEAFSKLYYTERILPVVQSRSSAHEGALITLIADVTKELYESAVKDRDTTVIGAVALYIDKAKKAMEVEDEEESMERTPQQYQDAIDELDDFFREVADLVWKKAGLAISIYAGGPMPRLGGKIRTMSHHKGVDAFGNTFGQSHKDLSTVYITPYHSFLRNKYPAEVRAARSLLGVSAPENMDEILHVDLDEPPKALLDNPVLLAMDPSPPLSLAPNSISAPSASVVDIVTLPLQVAPNTISASPASIMDAGLTNMPPQIIEPSEMFDQQLDLDWDQAPQFPEPEPTSHSHNPFQSNPLPNMDDLHIAPTLEFSATRSGGIPDQRPGFELNESVRSPPLHHLSVQASASVLPAVPASRPKPIPAPLLHGAVLSDPWADLGRRRPKTPTVLAPGARLPDFPNSNKPPVISKPPPNSVSVLKLRAAAEAEARAMAEMKASIEASKAPIEAPKASNGDSLFGSSSPDQLTPSPALSIPDPSTSANLSPSAHSVIVPASPIVVPTTATGSIISTARGRQRTLTPAGILLAEKAAKQAADRERKKTAKKDSQVVASKGGKNADKPTNKRNSRKKAKK